MKPQDLLLHPRNDPQLRVATNEVDDDYIDDYIAYKARFDSVVKYRGSDFNEMMSIYSTLSPHITNEDERLRVASKVLTSAKSRFMSVDILGAIDSHITDVDVHRRLEALGTPSADLLGQRINGLKEESDKLQQEIAEKQAEIQRLEGMISNLRGEIEHAQGVRAKIDDDISDAQAGLKKSFHSAADDVITNLIRVKNVLKQSSDEK